MMTKQLCAISTISILALSASSIGCGQTDDSETVTSAITGQIPVAFQRSDHSLSIDTGFGESNTSIPMASGTVPSQVTLSNGHVEIGFQKSDGHWATDEFNSSNNSHIITTTGGLIRAGTSPTLAIRPGCSFAFGFQGTDGKLWFGLTGNPNIGNPSTAFLAAGTSPSFALGANCTLVFAFQGTNGHMWVSTTGIGGGGDSGHAMAAGTSPSIAVNLTNNLASVAFQGSNGHLFFGGAGQQLDKNLGIKAGTSPTVAISADGTRIFVAYQASTTGGLHVWRLDNGAESDSPISVGMQNSATPRITPFSTRGYQIALKGSNGDLTMVLNTSGDIGADFPQTGQDEGFPMN